MSSYVLIKKAKRSRKGVRKLAVSGFLPRARVLLSVMATFILVDLGWVFFRADNFSDAWFVVSHLFADFSFNSSYLVSQLSLMGFDKESFFLVVLLLGLLIVSDVINYRKPIAEVIGSQKAILRWTIYLVVSAIIVFCFMFTAQSQNFIYFQF